MLVESANKFNKKYEIGDKLFCKVHNSYYEILAGRWRYNDWRCPACEKINKAARDKKNIGYRRLRARKWREINQKLYYKKQKEYRKAHPEQTRQSLLRWYNQNREKAVAHCKVSYAIKKGVLEKLPCQVCGNLKSQGHHHDYSKPLDVVWLCRKHHMELHRKI